MDEEEKEAELDEGEGFEGFGAEPVRLRRSDGVTSASGGDMGGGGDDDDDVRLSRQDMRSAMRVAWGAPPNIRKAASFFSAKSADIHNAYWPTVCLLVVGLDWSIRQHDALFTVVPLALLAFQMLVQLFDQSSILRAVRRLTQEVVKRDSILEFLEQSTDVFVIYDRELQLKYLNATGAAILGVKSEDVGKGITLEDVIGKDYIAGVEPFVREAITKKEQVFAVHEMPTVAGVRVYDAAYVPFVPRGSEEATAVIGVSRDVTNNENKIRELQGAKDAKSQFLATVSHEIRTPLGGIISAVQLLSATQLTVEQDQSCSLIQNAAEDLRSVVQDILDLSAMEAGKLTLDFLEMDIEVLVEECMDQLAPQAYSKGLELASFVQPSMPRRMYGDPTRLQQIIFNLLQNAVKFTETGEVVLAAYAQEVRADGTIRLVVSVRDSGVGIAADRMPRLFTRFDIADQQGVQGSGSEGMGLGLVICKQLCAMMGGDITVSTKKGFGSVFTFQVQLMLDDDTLVDLRKPNAQPEPTEDRIATVEWIDATEDIDTRTAEDIEVTGREAVLVAHPRQLVRDVLCDYIKAAGYKATPSVAAIRLPLLLASGRFAALVMDLPAPADIIALRTLRETMSAIIKSAGRDIHVVILAPQSSLKQLQPEVPDWQGNLTIVAKPVHRRALLAALDGSSTETSTTQTDEQLVLSVLRGDAARQTRRRVLIVEDNEQNLKLMRYLLQKEGLDIDTACNGLEAVEQLVQAHIPYDAVLMDCQMPDCDGFEATRRIRQLRGYAANTPIVALTAFAGHRSRCLEAGMNDFVTKPVQRTQLLSTLARCMQSSSSASEASSKQQTPSLGSVDEAASPQQAMQSEADAAFVNGATSGQAACSQLAILDVEAALEICCDDKSFLASLLNELRTSSELRCRSMRDALRTVPVTLEEIEVVYRAAHSLKGGSAQLHAMALADAATKLERCAREALSDASKASGKAAQLQSLLQCTEVEVARLQQFLSAMDSKEQPIASS
eukprot:jgi/Chlat1/1478/Chrsp12S02074